MTTGVVIATLDNADNAVERRFGPDGWLSDRGAP